jgi:methylated-DNA-protein-cysteine methyltransferase-like protein
LTRQTPGSGFFERVYALVREIPRGRVATYGQLAALLGLARGARAVGWALKALRGRTARGVPWHRVVGHGGRISLPEAMGGRVQRQRLRTEGVRFRRLRVDLEQHGLWQPHARARHSVQAHTRQPQQLARTLSPQPRQRILQRS